jgi:negative regulator of flagellin synthesis FlgM
MSHMKVNPDKSSPAVDPSHRTKTITPQPKRADQASKPPASADHLELSPKAKAIRRAAQVLAHTQNMREAKVQALQQAVQSGTYTVTPEQIAEKMLKEAVLEELP